MSSYFLDTSALVKRYHVELGTVPVMALFENSENMLSVSELTLVEVASAFRRRKNRGEITESVMRDALSKFEDDVLNRFSIINIDRSLIERAKTLVLQYEIRTLDAIQLAAALTLQDQFLVFVTADDKLLQAAEGNGLKSLNPLHVS